MLKEQIESVQNGLDPIGMIEIREKSNYRTPCHQRAHRAL